MKVSEPAINYNTPYLQGLKNRIIAFIDRTSDEEKLEKCLEFLHLDTMPCRFSEEELDAEIRLSKSSGYMTQEEALAEFAKWGFVR